MAFYSTELWRNFAAACLAAYAISADVPLYAQQQAAQTAAPADTQQSTEITDEEMQVLVARIALYPDELVALITSASLYPLQIVEASRFLDQLKTNKDLKPKDDWDGSIVSLLNYPDVVKMMSEDLDWTQQLGDAVASQQKDMLIAIQTLRDKAVADGIIKSDDKVKVVQQNDNVIIQAADPEKIYVPQYQPQMLYEEGYAPAPISYYPDPYPNYFYPTATFFAGFVTGAVFGAAVDWDRWGVWGGHYDGNDIDIDCDHCFNGIDRNGKVNFNDVDWKNVDRSKLKFDHNQFANIDRSNIRNRLEAGGNNDIRERAKTARTKARDAGQARVTPAKIKDVRANHARPNDGLRPGDRIANRPAGARRGEIGNRPDRQIHKPAMAGKHDMRPNRPSGLGEVRSRGAANLHSQRGGRAMGGGHFAAAHGGGHREFSGHRGGGGGGHMRRPHGGRHR
ncbi:DUF3300 domain-containing protein [Aliirhizobium terrae]|uniref:DUF3300 domain-containing protein n=1 Tax=Terrirhizobium terrae TaxID=2926709 RepID=UPI0025785E96|nr:DUF3300 domain-containing protein [Rhizobium sp. CC-CFT758]WJH41605.1 DUF3300 domain-containing protein [Rhizobium sp. CC-CFT758]